MSSSEFLGPNQGGLGAGINSQIADHRAKAMVVHNSRILIGVTLLGSLVALFMAVCMVLVVISDLFPVSALNTVRAFNAVQWGVAALATGLMCPWLWKMGRAMANYRVKLDSRGVDFNLGTNKNPQELFMAWDQVAAIKHKRVGNAQQYLVEGIDGSEARFSSYTFFRPKRIARLIAERTGIAIQEA
jgi:hypothetical protein